MVQQEFDVNAFYGAFYVLSTFFVIARACSILSASDPRCVRTLFSARVHFMHVFVGMRAHVTSVAI